MNAMEPTVYIETSVIFYYTARISRDLIVAGHQQITQEWWETVLPRCEPVVSPIVLEEIERGDPEEAKKRVAAVQGMAVLDVPAEVRDFAGRYRSALGLPHAARADAYHLAVTAWHGVDYLVTWNCAHLAAAMVERMLRRINPALGIATPVLTTPEGLMEL